MSADGLGLSNSAPGKFKTPFRVRRRSRRSTTPRRASPELLRRSTTGRLRRRTLTRIAPQLLSSWSVAILLAVLAVSGYRVWTMLEMRRVERLLAIPRRWPDITTGLPLPATATLTTSYEGAFLHYRFTVTPRASDKAATDAIETATFTLRFIDQEGFSLLVFRPDELTLDTREGGKTFRAEDVVGSSARIYGAATKWLVTWEGR